MTPHFTSRSRAAALLLGLALAAAGPAHAQTVPSMPGAAVDGVVEPPSPTAQDELQPPPLRIRHIDIGSATQALLDLQRASPGARPRPIDGEQASRSYQRYLKSFETTIPEHYSSGLGLAKK